MKKENSCLVLLSGGIDSTALVQYYLDLGYKVKAAFIDYGQAASQHEGDSALAITNHYKIHLDKYEFRNATSFSEGEIIGRNGFLVLGTLLSQNEHRGLISLGVHSGTPYYDCSSEFVNVLDRMIEDYTSGTVRIDTPFLKWDKSMIIEYGKNKNIPLQLTYSCEKGTKKPCGRCNSCRDRRVLGVF